MRKVKGCDVSTSAIVCWRTLKHSRSRNVFCLIQMSKGQKILDDFLEGYKHANESPMLIGAFHETEAINEQEMLAEIEMLNSFIKKHGITLDLPFFISLQEDNDTRIDRKYSFDYATNTMLTKMFCENVILPAGIKAPLGWLDIGIDFELQLKYPIWNVEHGLHDHYQGLIWQDKDCKPIRNNIVGSDIMYVEDDVLKELQDRREKRISELRTELLTGC